MPDAYSPYEAQPETWVDTELKEAEVTVYEVHGWGGLDKRCQIL